MPNMTSTKPARDRREVFIRHYLIHSNATRACRESGYKEGSGIHQSASNLLRSPYVQDRLEELRQGILAALDIKVEAVLARYKAIAFTNVTEVVQLHRTPCRYCWGTEHAFQWRTKREWRAACASARTRQLPEPDCDGGFGYTRDASSNDACPECDGYGIPQILIKDLRFLSDGERALVKSVVKTRYGTQVRFHDQLKALNALAQHLQFGIMPPITANPTALSLALAEIQSRGTTKNPIAKSA